MTPTHFGEMQAVLEELHSFEMPATANPTVTADTSSEIVVPTYHHRTRGSSASGVSMVIALSERLQVA
jgi:hypothetical protein